MINDLTELIKASQGHKIYSAKALSLEPPKYTATDFSYVEMFGRDWRGVIPVFQVNPNFAEVDTDEDEDMENYDYIETQVRAIDEAMGETYRYVQTMHPLGFWTDTFAAFTDEFLTFWNGICNNITRHNLDLDPTDSFVTTFEFNYDPHERREVYDDIARYTPFIRPLFTMYFEDIPQEALERIGILRYEVSDLWGEDAVVFSIPNWHVQNRRVLIYQGGTFITYITYLRTAQLQDIFHAATRFIYFEDFEALRRNLYQAAYGRGTRFRALTDRLPEDLALNCQNIYDTIGDPENLDWNSLDIAITRFKEAFLREVRGER